MEKGVSVLCDGHRQEICAAWWCATKRVVSVDLTIPIARKLVSPTLTILICWIGVGVGWDGSGKVK
jgi:hypothetical protein